MSFTKSIIAGLVIMSFYCQANQSTWEWAKYGIPESKNPACIPTPRNDWAKGTSAHLTHKANTRNKIPILFLGDSITQLWTYAKTHKYPGGLDSWNKYFKPLKAVNFGIAGDKIENVLWRITAGKQLKMKPQLIVLLVGTNNLHGKDACTVTQVVEGIKLIIDVIKKQSPQSKVLLLGITSRTWSKKAVQKVKLINSELGKYTENKQVFYFNVNPSFLSKDGKVNNGILRDGIHFSPEGYEIFAKALLAEIKKLLKK